jgi:hypothetical protein
VLIYAKEAEEGRIDLKDDDPETVGYLMDYMYEGDYVATGDNDRWLQVAWHGNKRLFPRKDPIQWYGCDHWLFKMTRQSPPDEFWRRVYLWELSVSRVSPNRRV